MYELGLRDEQIFIDKASGKDFARIEYQKLLSKLERGDLLIVKSIDRLGRNYEQIQENWRMLNKEMGIDIFVIDMPLLDTRRDKDLVGVFLSDTILSLLSFVAANERDNIHQRQSEGIKSAKARGVQFGRPIKKPPKNFTELVRLWRKGKLNFKEILEQTNLKQATFYRRLREIKKYS